LPQAPSFYGAESLLPSPTCEGKKQGGMGIMGMRAGTKASSLPSESLALCLSWLDAASSAISERLLLTHLPPFDRENVKPPFLCGPRAKYDNG
jgi:hypothetical protein